MSRLVEINGRKFWILSEPYLAGWKSMVGEAQPDGSSQPVGIEATGSTRTTADDAAERKLRLLVKGAGS
jgi:hypothetical protein